jgi:ubiquinone/menaquinone biosynthesis C-methylase UbiE
MANVMPSVYVLGYSNSEQDRLIRQATLLEPVTERLFREAGIGAGCHVLDIGSGIGDVAMIAARLVGASGEVLGIERNASFVARARERVAIVGFRNVMFVQADANALSIDGRFDAVVGRLVLNHNPDPVAMLRSVRQLLIPGGVLAFQEIAASPALAVAADLPLCSRVVTRIQEMIHKSGMNPDAGLALHRVFQEAGFAVPHIHLDVPFTQDVSIAQLEVDLLRSLAGHHEVSLADLGDLETLAKRIHTEAVAARSAIGFMAIVSAWSRKVA